MPTFVLMSKEVLITAQSLTKRYGQLEVLRGIDINIHSGEILSITGKSGAGKSTLVHILGTLDSPDSGAINIAGQNILKFDNKSLARFRNEHIGFIFQFHYLLQEFTALENVGIPGMIAGKSQKEIQEKASYLLNFLGLSDRKNHKPNELSGGEQQRVAVARALMNDPTVVIADEPTGNLDSQNSQELYELFFKMREELNQTFIIVTHNNELARLGDRIVQLADGQIISDINLNE